MKRSKMAEILAKYMTKGSDMLRPNEEVPDWELDCAYDLLELLEEEGMLPPSKKIDYKERQALRICSTPLGEFEYYHSWEPEDEKK